MSVVPTPRLTLSPRPSEREIARLADELELHPVAAALAWQRGLRDRNTWLAYSDSDPTHQHDPHLLPDMDAAVERLIFAREHEQRVLIHGDYDVDGLTGAAVMFRALRDLGMDAHVFVPHREKDGYGLSRRALENALKNGCSLVVTVDCGSSEGQIIEEMALLGMETIVTDHHLATDLPEALAFVSPMRSDSTYPFPKLAGSTIAYKLARALYEALGRTPAPELWLDYVALGTVADVMPLTGENRLLVRAGLIELSKRMTCRRGTKADRHPAWRALAEVARISPSELNAQDLAFRFGPRLNAPGRIAGARLSLQLLTSDDLTEIPDLAREIENCNLERRRIEAGITESALAAAQRRLGRGDNPGVLVLMGEGWHPGVLGISASRLQETFNLPVLLGGVDAHGVVRGSGRAGEGLNLKELLDGAAEFTDRHGGHHRAVGFSLQESNWDAFAARVEELAPQPREVKPMLEAALEIRAEELDRDCLDAVELLAPFGEENPEPIFLITGVIPLGTRVIKKIHLRLEFQSPAGGSYSCIAFGRAEQMLARIETGVETDICVRLARDTFRKRPGEHGVSFHLVDFAPSACPGDT
ncbi:MAG: single-stranded-DNA-specific exonuclease RecJ [bacterium]|nr:single-stranded-DNA-specific exonuclease RecJ [bacterium]